MSRLDDTAVAEGLQHLLVSDNGLPEGANTNRAAGDETKGKDNAEGRAPKPSLRQSRGRVSPLSLQERRWPGDRWVETAIESRLAADPN
jgi:hypothetical protein